jgi:hypothetical protein
MTLPLRSRNGGANLLFETFFDDADGVQNAEVDVLSQHLVHLNEKPAGYFRRIVICSHFEISEQKPKPLTPVIDIEDDEHVPGQERLYDRHAPLLQCLWQHGVVGVVEHAGRDAPRLVQSWEFYQKFSVAKAAPPPTADASRPRECA